MRIHIHATPQEEHDIATCRADAKAGIEVTVAALVKRQLDPRLASR